MDNRQQQENRLKQSLARLSRPLTIQQAPPPPQPPADLFGQAREFWAIQQRVTRLEQQQSLIIRYAQRFVIAIISVAAPALGFGFVTQLLKALGLM